MYAIGIAIGVKPHVRHGGVGRYIVGKIVLAVSPHTDLLQPEFSRTSVEFIFNYI